MHADNRNPRDASTAFAGMRPLAFLIAQIARLSQWRPRLPLTIGVVGPAILVLGCAPAHAQEHQNALQQEIAVVEQQVDSIESEALATIPSLVPGSPERLPRLGKILFFDKELSVNHNEACAFCHMPQTGFQGAIESLNRGAVAQPGSVRTRFSLRKPPSAAYAAFSPPLFYPDKPGEAKCSHCFIGGNFWDLRATGLRLQSPTAMQAEGSPLNPTEMANPDPACVVRRMSERPYRELFESVWGPRAFDVDWPPDVDALCSRPSDNPSSAIGSEVPGPNTAPLVVNLTPKDRARVQSTFDQMAEAIAAYEASPEVSPFASKFDAFLAGKAELSDAERRGYELFNGQAKCLNCHVDPKGTQHPLFTDNSTSNLGVPRNPALAFYRETEPDMFGYVPNSQGEAVVDKGVGNFLRSPENANQAWKEFAPQFDGRFRVATLRNVDKRAQPDFVKAYMHNGYFKSLKEVVHFYNTRDALPRCAAGSPGEKVSCWPPPEVAANINTNCCDLGLSDTQEDDLVSFLGTLTDGYAGAQP
jgi:cytochrome c peroxidase